MGELKENERLSERIVGDRFGVSRTIVREAFYELKKNGWLYAAEKSGTYVAPVDNNAIAENYEARIRLEPTLLQMAFPYITAQDIAQMRVLLNLMETGSRLTYIKSETALHLLIIQKTANRYVSSFFSAMHEGMMRAAARTSSGSGHRSHDSVKEWKQIIDLLDAGDILMASHFLETHMINSFRSFRENMDITEGCSFE